MSLEVITQVPTKDAVKRVPLLCVHGIVHGAWCWDEYWLPYFAQHGYIASALSLRGHGASPINGSLLSASIDDYVQDVVTVANQIEAQYGQRPLLIGHSMGGLITQKYLEKYAAPGAVLLASVPIGGTLRSLLSLTAHFPRQILQTTAMFRKNPPKSSATLARYMAFSADMPDEEVERYRRRFGGESLRAFVDMALLALPRPKRVAKIPLLVLCAENDTLFTVFQERATAKAYGATFEMMPATAHDMMLERTWQHSADSILKWLADVGF